jgi:Tol biopolymer transport system component
LWLTPPKPNSIYWSPDERQFVYITRREGHLIQLVSYDTETGKNNILQELSIEEYPAYLAFNLIGFSPDGQEIAFNR